MSSSPRHLRRALAIPLAALALVAGACSDDGDEDVGSSTTTTEESSSEPGGDTSTTTTAEPACPRAEAPDSDTTVEADVDGDGAPDEVGSTERPGELVLHVTLAAGGDAVLVLPTFGVGGTGLIGPADVDGDGAAELWVRTGSGASAAIVGLARFADCQLVQVTFAAGGPAELPVGGSVGTSAGLSCDGSVDPTADVTTYLASNVGEETYEVTATEYALDGPALTQLGSTTSTATSNDPAFARYVSFDCDGLAL